ncbi:MAG: cadherin domain-containing protein [Xanthomonadales bacterium]|nr:cadherin domain-containing protein [Xanthomonadales bacterium]
MRPSIRLNPIVAGIVALGLTSGLVHAEFSINPARAVSSAAIESPSDGANNIVFVDTRIDDWRSLVEGSKERTQVIRVDADNDGLSVLVEAMRKKEGIASVVVFSHGAPGMFRLGSENIDANAVENHAHAVESIRAALSPNADIVIAGCSVAQGDQGRRFIDEISTLTGANVYASDDQTGSTSKGGDWSLEYVSGSRKSMLSNIEESVFTDVARREFRGLLATSFTSSKSGGANPLSGIADPDVGVIVGDFDSDGDIDVLGYDDDTYSSTTFFQNDGNGNFSAVSGASDPFDAIAGTNQFWASNSTYTADFDNDGDIDIWDFEGQTTGDGTSRYYENTNGTNYTSSVSGGANPLSGVPDTASGVIFGDFDTDGDVDVLGYDDDTYSSTTFYQNDGSGNFSAVSGASDPFDAIAGTDQFWASTSTYTADFDSDGDVDIWDFEGQSTGDGTSRYFENTDGTTYTSSVNAGANPLSGIADPDAGVIVGDFDTDGDIDVLGYDDDTYSSTTFYQNDGSGNFAAVTGASNPFDAIADTDQFWASTNAYVADFDNDGDVDIWDFEGQTTGDGTSIYLEQLETPPTIISSTPSDDATGVSVDTNVVITFDESVQLGTGNMEVRRISDDTAVVTLSLSGGSVTGGDANATLSTVNVSDDTLTINPDATLPGMTGLYVDLDAGTLIDSSDGAAALSLDNNPTTLNFTTGTANNAPTLDLDTGSAGDDHTAAFSENAHQGNAVSDGVAVTGVVATSDSDGSIESATFSLDNPQGDAGEGLAVDTAPLASALGFTASSNQITITRNSASLAELIEAMEAVRYQNDSDAPDLTTRTVAIEVADDGGASTGRTSTITIEAGNDAPTITGPGGTLQPDEDVAFDLSGTDEIQIADVDAGGGTVEVSLSANNGTLTLGSITGLAFDSGGNGTGAFTVSGTVTDLNNALATLDYQGNPNYFGADTISATVNDRGNSGTDPGLTADAGSEADSTAIALDVQPVPDAPTITAIANQSTDEDTTLSGIAFAIDDAETAAGSLSLTFGSDTPSLIESHAFGGSGTNRTLQITPAQDQNGSAMITMEVSDGSLTTQEVFELTVNAVNDLPTATPAINTFNTTVDEDDPVPAFSFTVDDVESGGAGVTVTASSDNQTLVPNANLTVADNGGGNRALDVTLAADENGSANITVTLDDGTDTVDDSFTLTVAAQNDPPAVSLDQNSTTIDENNGGNITVAQITIDDDNEDGSTNELSLNGADAADFAISGAALDFTGNADFEAKDTYDVTVEVDDPAVGSTPDDTANFTLNISNVDEAPSFSATGPFSVSESVGNGTAVGDVDATDGDGGATDANVSYAIVGGNTGGAFAIDVNVGSITVADADDVDYDTSPTFNLDVEANDGTNTATATITVNLINAAPSTPVDSDGDSAGGGSVSEDAPNGTTVGITADASDPGGGPVSYDLTDTAGGRFQINAATGVVTVADTTLIDFESATSHTITAQAADDEGADSDTASFTIAVTDVDSPPEFVATGPFSVSESAGGGSPVGDVDANDGDGGSADAGITYAITGGNGGAFAIDNSGAIIVADASAIDFENSSSFALTVEADDGGSTASATVTVDVIDEPPAQPVDTDGGADSVAEDAANGDPVGVDVTSSDPVDGTVTYVLTDDASGRFAIDANGLVTVADGSLLDFETDASHDIEIEAQDADDTASATLAVTIEVTDVNEAPTLSAIADQTTDEDQPLGTIVLTVGDVDDPPGELTLSLSSDDPSLIGNYTFGGSDTERSLELAPAPDAFGTANVSVAVNDGDLSTSRSFVLEVEPVNDPPRIVSSLNDRAMVENQGSLSFDLRVDDVDDDADSLVVTGQSDQQSLIQDADIVVTGTGETRQVQITPVADRSGSASITMTVDDGTETASGSFNVFVRPFAIPLMSWPGRLMLAVLLAALGAAFIQRTMRQTG